MKLRPSDSPARGGTRIARRAPTVMYPIGLVVHSSGHHPAPSASSSSTTSGFTPSQIRHAYGFDQLTLDGSGQTIAIVDAYHDPNLAGDLATFDQQFNLPALPEPHPGQPGGWQCFCGADRLHRRGWGAPEETLDVEWAHAIAPKANILVVEANSDNLSDLITAVDTARHAQGVVAVSMSWGNSEFSGQTSYDSSFTTPSGHSGVTFLAASGDSSAGAGWPAISSNVISVGGTTLMLDASNNRSTEVGWVYSSGGYSSYYTEPSYQTAYANSSYVQNTLNNFVLQGSTRGNPDVSFASDSSPGFAIYDSFAYNGTTLDWNVVGGTSAAAPQWAALVALADQGRGSAGSLDGASQTLPGLYQLAGNATSYTNDFYDITSGSNSLFLPGRLRPGHRPWVVRSPITSFRIWKTSVNRPPSVSPPRQAAPRPAPHSASPSRPKTAQGQTLTTYTGSIHFTTSDKGGGVVLPTDYTFTAADNGRHTFTNGATLVTAGSQTITATDKATSSITGQATVSVNAASASSVTLEQLSASSSPNAAFSVTVTAKDAYGNTATGYTGTVHFTTSDRGSGVHLPADYTFASSDKGSHTFTNGVTLVNVGSQTVTVTDKANSSLKATATVTVQAPQSATHLSIRAPSSSTAGSAFSITITDAAGYQQQHGHRVHRLYSTSPRPTRATA